MAGLISLDGVSTIGLLIANQQAGMAPLINQVLQQREVRTSQSHQILLSKVMLRIAALVVLLSDESQARHVLRLHHLLIQSPRSILELEAVLTQRRGRHQQLVLIRVGIVHVVVQSIKQRASRSKGRLTIESLVLRVEALVGLTELRLIGQILERLLDALRQANTGQDNLINRRGLGDLVVGVAHVGETSLISHICSLSQVNCPNESLQQV